MKTSVDTWDRRMIALAEQVATWSKDPDKQVGSVIADRENRVISVGFNGFPRGVADDARLLDREMKLALTLHAEDNAIDQAVRRNPPPRCTLYVTSFPCIDCAKSIVRAGFISTVVAPRPDPQSAWVESQELAIKLFSEANILTLRRPT